MFRLLPLLICVQALGEDAALDLEILPATWEAPAECAFPSWVVGASEPALLVTGLEGDGSARLLLFELGTLDTSRPARPLAAGTGWFLNWADIPAAASLADGTLAWSWLVASPVHEHSYGTRLQLASAAGARGAERPLEEHLGAGEHGFVSLAPAGPSGPGPSSPEGFLALWLDGRATHGHAGETRLYARAIGRDGTFGPEQLVDGRTCSCCPTSLVRLADGTHLAAWRDRSEREVRDIAVARFDGERWSEPERLHPDGWEIDGCPVNGPRLAVGPRGTAASWYTGAEGGRVRLALGDAAGRFGAPLAIDEGAPVGRGDVLCLEDGSVLVGWMEHGRDESRWCLRRVGARGEPGPVHVLATTSSARSSGFLRLAAEPGGALAAYTETAPTRRVLVRRIRPLP